MTPVVLYLKAPVQDSCTLVMRPRTLSHVSGVIPTFLPVRERGEFVSYRKSWRTADKGKRLPTGNSFFWHVSYAGVFLFNSVEISKS